MSIQLLFKGILIGLIIGVPIGVIGALTIQRTLAGGFWYGFLTGLGSSVADFFFSLLSVFCISFIDDFLMQYTSILGVCSSILVIIFGICVLFRKKQTYKETSVQKISYILSPLSSLSIAILNPSTLIALSVLIPSLRMIRHFSLFDGFFILSGIFIGTMFWWILLCCLVTRFRERVSVTILTKLNTVLGIILIAMGVLLFISNILQISQ